MVVRIDKASRCACLASRRRARRVAALTISETSWLKRRVTSTRTVNSTARSTDPLNRFDRRGSSEGVLRKRQFANQRLR